MSKARARANEATTIWYVVQAFRTDRKALEPDQPQTFKIEEDALAAAKRLATRKAGVVAYSTMVDNETGEATEPEVFFQAGQLPSGIFEGV